MRNRGVGLSIVLLFAACVLPAALVRAAQEEGGGRGAANSATPSGPAHDPHDLNGVWQGPVGGGGGNAAPPKTASAWASKMELPLTAAGLAQMNANKPGGGPRGARPAFGNDPIGGANPPGLMRTFLYGNFGVGFKFIQIEDEVMQIFDYGGFWRQIWTDGRKVPADPDPNWYGYSVGKWDGDAFVVQTVGLDPRAWLDAWGTPFSDSMKVEERWHRLDRDNLELTAKVDDPVMYTKTWVSDKKMYRLQPKGSKDGEVYQFIFAPMDEQTFNNNVRDPVAGVNHGTAPSK